VLSWLRLRLLVLLWLPRLLRLELELRLS